MKTTYSVDLPDPNNAGWVNVGVYYSKEEALEKLFEYGITAYCADLFITKGEK